ncbi:hypothetical protein AMTRI_Chr01g103070 [Amborella trichopoda]|uniref:Uncharacterized protein n=2 Tax=Amborella trichopoda TaxID=13333 RepID=W1NTX7_AMBTC|nr:hypothetical protein AMTR_s00101p00046210 [Amborella trichopoda]
MGTIGSIINGRHWDLQSFCTSGSMLINVQRKGGILPIKYYLFMEKAYVFIPVLKIMSKLLLSLSASTGSLSCKIATSLEIGGNIASIAMLQTVIYVCTDFFLLFF